MKANLKKLQILPYGDDAIDAWMRNLYQESFPAEEQRPWDDLMRRWRTGEIAVYGIGDSQDLTGFITVWRFPGLAYVEHFAIEPRMRGRGLGTEALSQLKTLVGDDAIVLEVEPPTSYLAQRRIKFYEASGFRLHSDFEYLQPPYGPDLPWVPLKLMTFVKNGQNIDLESIKRNLHTAVYNVK